MEGRVGSDCMAAIQSGCADCTLLRIRPATPVLNWRVLLSLPPDDRGNKSALKVKYNSKLNFELIFYLLVCDFVR